LGIISGVIEEAMDASDMMEVEGVIAVMEGSTKGSAQWSI